MNKWVSLSYVYVSERKKKGCFFNIKLAKTSQVLHSRGWATKIGRMVHFEVLEFREKNSWFFVACSCT